MGKKATKATKRFVSSGKLKKTIEARHKAKQIQKKIQSRRGNKGGKGNGKERVGEEEEDGEEEREEKGSKRMTVDSFLNGDFMDESEEEDLEDDGELDNDGEDEDEVDAEDDNASFASVDDLDEEGQNHLLELSKLAEKDPEFFKYLQENDRDLLEFDPDGLAADSDHSDGDDNDDNDEDVEMEEEKIPVLTKEHLRKWQKPLLQQHSLRALRNLLLAFRSAAHMNEEGQVIAWSIDSSSVYNKLVTTALRYTPIVLEYHVPYKTLPNGQFKPPTQTHKFKTLQKLILSHFHNITHMLSQLTDEEMLRLALTESAKLVPYIISSRKSVKTYLKKCLDLWSSATDPIRLTSFLSIRRLASSSDESILDTILKSTYLSLLRASKSTSPYTLPSINLMKNSASDVFCTDHGTAYQHAFGYIRQLAIHLRNSMKVKTKEAYKNVYNWQFAHSVDFWCIVLGRACDTEAEAKNGKESELRPLIYPLVQVALGAVKLVPSTRSTPFHLHIIRSLLHLSKHTGTYIPLSPYLIPILTSSLSPSSFTPKASTLRPLDFETAIRVPQQYVKTRVLSEGVVEEGVWLLGEWLGGPSVGGSVGFPEVVVPICVLLRRGLKGGPASSSKGKKGKGRSASGKEHALVKTLLERVEETARWVEDRRRNVGFAPGKTGEVDSWEREAREKVDESPLGRYLRVQRKVREKRRSLLEKAREGKEEVLEQDGEDED